MGSSSRRGWNTDLRLIALELPRVPSIDLAEYHESTGLSRFSLFKEHAKTLKFLVFLFLGFLVSFTLWYTFLPAPMLDTVFSLQASTIQSVG